MTIDLNRRDRFFGQSICEYIMNVGGELDVDAVGVWQIFSFGRDGFHLNDGDINEFLRLCILSLLNKGARPVIGGGVEDKKLWIVQEKYNGENEDVVDMIMSDWFLPGKDPDPGGLWFALPKIYGIEK